MRTGQRYRRRRCMLQAQERRQGVIVPQARQSKQQWRRRKR